MRAPRTSATTAVAVAAAAAVAGLAGCSIEKKVALTDAGVDGAPPLDGPGDEEAPETAIEAAPGAFSRQGASTFRFRADDPEATFTCSIDGETPVPCTSPYTRTLGDGAHAFSVRAADRAGNSDPTPAEHVWTIDTVAPETTLLAAPPPADNSAMVQFEFRANEAGASFECSLDNGAYLPCQSGGTWGPIGDGAHAFAVRARDRAGNLDASPVIHAWLVDTSTPDTQIVAGPSGATAQTSATFTFVSPDAGGGATFQCSLDGAPFTACTSPRDLAGLAAGAHTFAVRVRDAVGNVDPTPATRAWTVDLTPPETSIVAGPSGLEAVASASFTFASNEAGATFECSLDGAPFAACVSPFTATALAQGEHAFAVRAVDGAGHADASPATRAWTVDTVPPDVAIIDGPPAGGASGPRVVLAFAASDGQLACSLDGAAYAPCASPLAANLPAGVHELRVRATDAAGNTETASRAWTVICAAPEAAGAAGLLHLDETDQVLANAAGGAPATLGDGDGPELADPAPVAGRFGGALAFSAAEGDRAAWPLALPAAPGLALELWARPQAGAGARDVIASADGRLALRAVAAGGGDVRFAVTAVAAGAGGEAFTATSAPVPAGAWHHVVVSLDEPHLRLWVNGARTQQGGVALNEPLALDALRLGGGGYQGELDEVWLGQAPLAGDEAALQRYCPVQ